MVGLLLVLLLEPSPGYDGFRAGCGFHGYGGADLSKGLSSLGVDSLFLFPSASVLGDGYAMKTVLMASSLSGEHEVQLLHASGGLRLQGTPWIGVRAAYGADSPFLYGIGRPWLERRNSMRDSLVSATLEGGGILGFNGFYGAFREGDADTLIWAGIRSPWIGFAQFWWDGFRGPVEMNTVTGFVRIAGITPWISASDSAGAFRGDAEVEGIHALLPRSFSLVPWVHYSDADSTQAGLKVLFAGGGSAQAGVLRIGLPVQGRGSFTAMLRYSMQSMAGIHWDAGLDAGGDDDWAAVLSGEYRATPAGFGLGLSASDDSVRVTGRASYSPVPSVAAEVLLSSDVFDESADPEGAVTVSAFRGPVVTVLGFAWRDGSSILSLELGGWLGI